MSRLAKLPILMRLVHLLPPETAHLLLALLNIRSYVPGYSSLRPRQLAARQIMGLHFANPCGLAAGLDKNGTYIRGLQSLGLGFIELGTVTPRPQAGHARPRLRRLPGQQALLNRMGFPNKGVEYLLARLKHAPRHCPIGINLGVNQESMKDEEAAQRDYLQGLGRVYVAADYVCINVSSPNTQGLRSLQKQRSLAQLLRLLKRAQMNLKVAHNKYTPLVVKLSPDLNARQIKECAHVINDSGFDGVTATNTSAEHDWQRNFGGGISGSASCPARLGGFGRIAAPPASQGESHRRRRHHQRGGHACASARWGGSGADLYGLGVSGASTHPNTADLAYNKGCSFGRCPRG